MQHSCSIEQSDDGAVASVASGGSRTYTYNKRNRLSNALIGAISWDYTYNGQEQLIIRQRTGSTALG